MAGDRRGARKSFGQKTGRIVLIAISAVLGCMAILVGVLLIWSPGKPQPFLDAGGRPAADSLSEKIWVNINGVNQGMFIKSKDVKNPVLLYLHGGMPDYFLTQSYPTGLENIFTVCWWEQRGSGLSYRAGTRPETITADQLILDTLEVTRYLRKRFGKDRIYLMGHSGGTFIGIQAVARAPELYSAYIGVAQMSDQRRSEQLAYDYMISQFKKNGDSRMLQKLEAAPVSMTAGTPAAYLAVRDIAMHRLGVGTMHDMKSVAEGIFLRSVRFREYTLAEKINLWRAKASAGTSVVWQKVITTNLAEQVPQLNLPVYFFEGIYDYTCSYVVAKSYFEILKSPLKGFYTFEKSAHSPMFEEPEKVEKILREDVLTGSNRLADET